jgi:membrane protease YdiL (CAAX protease family)
VFAYLALTFGISWGGILLVMGATGFDLKALQPLDTGLIFVAMLLGPFVSGLFMQARLEGWAGLREMGSRVLRWRVGVAGWAVALLTMPVMLLTVLWTFSATVDAAFAPRFQWPLFAVGLVAGAFEEIGWTGFATPRLLARHTVFTAGFALGLVWALWHALVDLRQNMVAMGLLWPLAFAVFYIGALTAYRMLMTWLYASTRSLLLAVVMHASYTGWLLVLYPATTAGQGLVWQTAFAAALWLLVACVMVAAARRGQPAAPTGLALAGGSGVLLGHPPAPGLDLAAPGLAFQPAPLCCARRLRGHARCVGLQHLVDQRLQPRQRVGLVARQAAVRLRLDDDHAVFGDALVGQRPQQQLHVVGQRRRGDVEAQVRGTGHLVHVLPAGTLRTHGRELDLAALNLDAALHGSAASRTGTRGASAHISS